MQLYLPLKDLTLGRQCRYCRSAAMVLTHHTKALWRCPSCGEQVGMVTDAPATTR